MKRSIYFFITGCLLMCSAVLGAQQSYHRCHTVEHLNAQLAADPQLQSRMDEIEQHTQDFIANQHGNSRATVTIPVVVHVLYNTAAQNISDALINAQIQQLNLDYARQNSDAGSTPSVFQSAAANTNIQFCLAQRDPNGNPTTGIIRKSTTVTSFIDDDKMKSSSTGGDNAWPASSYLNIWTVNFGNNLLGYAQFPGGSASTDGVVLLYSSVGSMQVPGSASPYNLGRTATHEVGHWLNLRHIWGDDGTSCTGSDLVSDTPNQADENYGCPAFPNVSCSNGPNGEMFMNYMDYTDDGCMNMFTAGQASRMQALFVTGGSRVGLVSSLGCQPVVVTGCGVPAGLGAGSITTSGATISWGAVANAVSYNYQYRVVGSSTWTTGNTTATSVALAGLNQSTNYEFQVQTVCAAESSAFSASATFTTATPSTCSDNYESNNTSSTAKTPALNTNLNGFITPSTDVDWFKFTTTSATGTRIKVDLTTLPADYDVILYKSNASTKLATGANSGTTSESIKYNTSSTGTYYVKVYGYNGATSATSCYTLKISTSTTNFRLGDGNEGNDVAELVAEPVMKLYPNPASDKLTAEFLSTTAGNVKLSVYNLNGQRVLQTEELAAEGLNTITVNTNALGSGVYVFEVYNNGETQRMKFTVSK